MAERVRTLEDFPPIPYDTKARDNLARELGRQDAEIERLRAAFEEYRLWEPGRRGYAEARRRLECAFDEQEAGR